MQESSGNSPFSESADLVLHQGNQGRDDDRETREEQGRDLVAEGFARAGRHDAEYVISFKERTDQTLLTGPERTVAVIRPKCLMQFIHVMTFLLANACQVA